MARVYYFAPAQFALDNLHKRRLKVSRLEDLNDPFELLAAEVMTKDRRAAVEAWSLHMSRTSRLLCFSTDWRNPVMWSHYADKHRGLCLGFDVPPHLLLEVSYEPKRLEKHVEKGLNLESLDEELARELLTTKFQDWRYESEVRILLKPEDTYNELGNDFYAFSSQLQLQEVMIGPRRQVSPEEVKRALQSEDSTVVITQTRLAWSDFKVLDDEPT
jgi:hypothetical protein